METPVRRQRLSGNWLTAARVAWLILLLGALAKQGIGLPLYFEERMHVCADPAEAACTNGNALTWTQAESLQSAGISLQGYALTGTIWRAITSLIWTGIGVFVFFLRPDDRMAWIASVMMILFSSGGFETQIAQAYPTLAGAANLSFSIGNLFLFLFIALFPDGRFSPRWTRAYWVLLGVTGFLDLNSLEAIHEVLAVGVIVVIWLSFMIVGTFTQIYKYRSVSGPMERQQTKWVVAGFSGMAAFVLAYFVAILLFGQDSPIAFFGRQVFDLAALLLPLSIGLSILRYRLWDIDLIIRKTLVYALLTGLLALVYFGGVVLLQGVFEGLTGVAESPLVTVVTTLGVAALFNPLRGRVQDFIDRRFYRTKYDAALALENFAISARDKVNLEQLAGSIFMLVEDTVQPTSASLWLSR